MITSPTPPREGSVSPKQSLKRKVHFRVCKFSYFEPGLEQEIALDRPKDLYYKDSDFDLIEQETRETVRRMMRSKSSPAQLEKNLLCRRNLSSRGLEEHYPERAREQLRIQTKAVRLILMVQKFQKDNGDTDPDPEVMAKRYRKLAAKSATAAHVRGLQDQIFAEWIAEGCPEDEPETSASENVNLKQENVADNIQKSVDREMNHLVGGSQHRRTQSPHFNFLCGPSIGQFFQHKQLFEVIDIR